MVINTRDPTVTAELNPTAALGSEPSAQDSAHELARLRAELELTRRELAHSRAENQRQLSIDRLHAGMLANVLDAVITIDTQQRIRYLNPAAESQYRVRASEVIGAPLTRLYRCCWSNPADAALVNDALQSTGRWRGEYEQELPDGTRLQVEAVFSVLRDDTGTALGTLACMRDVSDRASRQSALLYSEEQLRNWLLNIPAPIYIKDREGRYLLANQWAEQTLRTPLGVIGRDDFELMPRAAAAGLREHDREVLESNRASQREQVIYDRHYLSLQFPLRSSDGRPTAVCGVSIDITELKQAQLELVEARNQLRKPLDTVMRLHQLATQSLPAGDPEALLEPILQTALDLHDASLGLISLLDHGTGGLQAVASINLDALAVRQLTGLQPVPGGGACGEFSGPQRVVIDDIETGGCLERFREVARRIGFRAVHSTPILTRGGFALGILSLYFKQPRSPTELETQVAELCARQAADCIEATANHQALRESEERFRTMADHAPVMVWVADAQHACTYLSKSWYEFTGQSAAQALGFGWSDAIHPDDRDEVYREFIRAADEHRSLRLECRFRRHDGTYRWCLDTATPRFTADGSFAGLVGSVVDITERKAQEEALRQSEKLYRAIGEALDYGIWICDADGRNRYVSDSFLRLVGLTQDECSLYGWVRHLHPDEAQETLASWRECVRSGGVWSRTCRFKGLDGKYHSMLVRGLPVRDEQGEVICWAGIILDVNREHQAHAAIQEAERRNDEFLALLSHHLRTPLASLRAALELLQLQAPRAEPHADGLTIIDHELDSLGRLVNDLLDLSRVNRGQLELRVESVPLHEAVGLAIEAVHRQLNAAEHELTLELPAEAVQLQADRMRLVQMLINLLDNSAKYTPARGHIKLSAQLHGPELHISVQDNGVGIAAALLPTIFSKHTQLDAGATGSAGLGIGLTLVKALAEQHGGHLTAHSDGEGKGSKFTLALPLAAAPPLAPTTSLHATLHRSSRACRVLIADDNPEAAQRLAMLLELMGHATCVVNDGFEAIDAVQSFAPDFVFMDIGMPKLDGIQAARRIRELGLAQQPRIVAVSGQSQPGTLELSQSAGMDYHVLKPISMRTLQALIDGNSGTTRLH